MSLIRALHPMLHTWLNSSSGSLSSYLTTKINIHNPVRYVVTILDLLLIRVLSTDPVFGPSRMVYFPTLSSDMQISLLILIVAWYQSVERKRRNHILNYSTLNQSTLFWLTMSRMLLMINFQLLATNILLILSSTSIKPTLSIWLQWGYPRSSQVLC